MSAFIVDPRTMDRVISMIARTREHGKFNGTVIPVHEFVGYPGVLQEIGEALYKMNMSAVLQRYPDCTEAKMPGRVDWHPSEWQYSPLKGGSLIQGIKAAHCLHYQCCEGDVMDTPLYKELVAVTAEASEAYISGLPEYDAAPWD